MIAAGELRTRLQMLSPASSGRDAGGKPIQAWPVAMTVSAKKVDVSDAERMRAEQMGATVTTRFVVRRSPLFAPVDATWRCRCTILGVARAFDIVGIKETEDLDGLEITARRRG